MDLGKGVTSRVRGKGDGGVCERWGRWSAGGGEGEWFDPLFWPAGQVEAGGCFFLLGLQPKTL